MSTVNPQITDAVTQANSKVASDAAAIAIGSLYQTISQSIAIALEDAVAAQQNINSIIDAATAKAINMLLAEGYPSAVLTGDAAAMAPNDARTIGTDLRSAAATIESTASTPRASIDPQIENAIKLANESVLGNTSGYVYALRAASDAAMAAIDHAGRTTQRNAMRAIQAAAAAKCMDAMIRHPEKADEYAKVLQFIHDFG
jgi:Killing trait